MFLGPYQGKLYRHMWMLYRIEVKVDRETAVKLRGQYANVYVRELGITLEKYRIYKRTHLNRIFVVIPRRIAKQLDVQTPMDVTVELEVV